MTIMLTPGDWCSPQECLCLSLMARSPDDQERNRFSARAARYARVGTNVGTVAAKFAASRLLGLSLDRGSERRRADGGARRAEGPDHEGRAIDGDHSGPAAARIRRGAAEAAERSPADGLGLRQAAHDGRARRRLAGEVFRIRAPAGRRRLARPGASRPRARRQAARRQAAVSRHAVGRGSRPAAARLAVRDPPPHGPGDRHHRDRQGDRRARARGARLSARGQARRALSRDARAVRLSSACRRYGRSSRPAGCSPSTGSRARSCSRTRARRSRTAIGSAPRCSPPGGCRSAATA